MPELLPPITHLAAWHDRIPRYAFVSSMVKDKTVLDLGCGSGEGTAMLAKAGAKHIVAIDPSSALIDEAKRLHPEENLTFLARFVEDPLDFGATQRQSGEFQLQEDDSEPAAEATLAVAKVEDVANDLPTAEADSQEGDEVVEEPPKHEPAQEPDSGQAAEEEPAQPQDAPTEGDGAADEGEMPQRFDIILALNPDLPIQNKDFLEQLASLLNPNGVLILSLRIDSSPCFSDLLAHFDANAQPDPISFDSIEAARALFHSVFSHSSEYAQFGVLTNRFLPASNQANTDFEIIGKSEEAIPRFRIFVLGQQPTLSALECHIPLEPLVTEFAAGLANLSKRALSLEHRGVLFDEELNQKERLIDDLEQEVRASDARRRELETQIAGLQHELDGLQAELTVATPPPGFEQTQRRLNELEPIVEEQRLALIKAQEKSDHATLLITRLREAMEAQRFTIDALNARIDLLSASTPEGEVLPQNVDRDELVKALKKTIEDRDKEIATIGAEVGRLIADQRRLEIDKNSAEKKVDQLELSLTKLQKDTDKAQQRAASKLKNEKDKAQQKLSQLSDKLDEQHALIQQKDSKLTKVEQELANHEQSMSAQTIALKEAQESIEALKKEAQKSAKEHSIQKKALQQSIEERDQELKNKAEEIQKLEAQIAYLERTIPRFKRGRRVRRAGLHD